MFENLLTDKMCMQYNTNIELLWQLLRIDDNPLSVEFPSSREESLHISKTVSVTHATFKQTQVFSRMENEIHGTHFQQSYKIVNKN